jgi:hypothetical protein
MANMAKAVLLTEANLFDSSMHYINIAVDKTPYAEKLGL